MAEDHEHVDHDHTARRARPSTTPDGGERATDDLAATLGNRGVEHVLRSTVAQRSGATSRQELDEAVARSIEDRRGAGSPLGDDVRADMEGALGADLGEVRVHHDPAADELNEAVSAQAFTSGSDVFFRRGGYQPDSPSGRELLAHELTHVVQQRTGTSGLEGGEVSDPSDPAELEASAVGAEIGTGGSQPAGVSPATAGVARQDEEEDELMMSPVARQDEEEDELMMAPVARQDEEEDELMMAPVARQDEEEDELMMAPVARQDEEEELMMAEEPGHGR